MDAIVLAAGEGSRFFGSGFERRRLPAGLEYPIPKSLYPITVPARGKEPRPVLEHLVTSLHDGGIEKAWIATGFLHEKIETFARARFDPAITSIIPPHPSIDFRKGPLYTLAGALDYLNEHGVLASPGFDKMIALCPADLVIDRKASWYIAGIPARGMMASRSRVHVIIENRRPVKKDGIPTELKDIIPERFQAMFDETLLGCPVVPFMAVHLDIMTSAIAGIAKGYTRFSEVLHDWLDTTIKDEREFKSEVNVIPTIYLGERFYWHDMDTVQAAREIEGGL